MNKRVLSILISCVMLFSVSVFAEGEDEAEKLISPSPASIRLTIGETIIFSGDLGIELDVAPCIVNDRTMVPLRAISELLGATVHWDEESRSIIIINDETAVLMQVGQSAMFVNSDRIELDAPSVIINDRTMVPLRAIAEAYGCTVDYDDETKTVTITL